MTESCTAGLPGRILEVVGRLGMGGGCLTLGCGVGGGDVDGGGGWVVCGAARITKKLTHFYTRHFDISKKSTLLESIYHF